MAKIIEITSPTCPVCRMMEPMLKVALQPFPHVKLEVHCNNTPDGEYYCRAYDIHQAPTFLFMNNRGDVIRRHSGAITLGEVRSIINQILTDYTR